MTDSIIDLPSVLHGTNLVHVADADMPRDRVVWSRYGRGPAELAQSEGLSVMYGPKLREPGGRLRQTYLIALLDDATRLVLFAAFALSEGTIAYLKVLELAVRRRGIPKRLYVDNGSAFRSRQLGAVCAKLGIALIHARPYTPQGKGKMERWFRTVRMQCLPLMAAGPVLSLTTMNQALAAWIEGEYHHAPHRGLHNETPADKWARSSQHGSRNNMVGGRWNSVRDKRRHRSIHQRSA